MMGMMMGMPPGIPPGMMPPGMMPPGMMPAMLGMPGMPGMLPSHGWGDWYQITPASAFQQTLQEDMLFHSHASMFCWDLLSSCSFLSECLANRHMTAQHCMWVRSGSLRQHWHTCGKSHSSHCSCCFFLNVALRASASARAPFMLLERLLLTLV